MVQFSLSAITSSLGLTPHCPHTRGGEPTLLDFAVEGVALSPRAWGVNPLELEFTAAAKGAEEIGCVQHAGIDGESASAAQRLLWVPPACGDRRFASR